MRYRTEGVALTANWVVDEDAVGKWITKDTVERCLLEPLRGVGMFKHATHYWVGSGKPRALPSSAQLAAAASKWRTDSVGIYTGDVHDPDWRYRFSPDPDQLRTELGITPRFIDSKTREHIHALVLGWSEALGQRGCRLSVATLMPGVPYPRPHPPRTGTTWPLGGLAYYLGRSWHQRDADDAAVFAALAKAKLPQGATRKSEGDVVWIALPGDLTDPAAVTSARAASEQWLTPLVPTKIERGWNELGDRLIVPPDNKVELPPFTYYDASKQIAYKGLIVDPDTREVDEEVWAEVAAIAISGRSHGGKPVKSVRLVFPIRDDAVFMHDRAISDGFEMVTYPKGTVLWQVSLLGNETSD